MTGELRTCSWTRRSRLLSSRKSKTPLLAGKDCHSSLCPYTARNSSIRCMNVFGNSGQHEFFSAPRSRPISSENGLTKAIWTAIDRSRSVSFGAINTDKRVVLPPVRKQEPPPKPHTISLQPTEDFETPVFVTVPPGEDASSIPQNLVEQTDDDETRPEEVDRAEED